MKNPQNLIVLLVSLLALSTTSCRNEESEFIQSDPAETLKSNSNVASLLKLTAMNDGSKDNILFHANCFSIELPVSVKANGFEFTISSEDELQMVEDIFDEFNDDDDVIELFFPIKVILADFTEVVINSHHDLESLAGNCSGENADDDDIECADIVYPVKLSVFNLNNEVIETITVTSDRELYFFVDDLNEDDLVRVNFPILVVLADGTEISVNSLDRLENILEDARHACDEDDDYDYNDDDCNSCNTEQLSTLLTSCTNWFIHDLERNNEDLRDIYSDFLFTFSGDGTLVAIRGEESFSGTWVSEGSQNNIKLTIDLPDLPDFNLDWNVHELEAESGERHVDLQSGNEDELRFRSNCP